MKQEQLKQALSDMGYDEVLLFESPDYASAFIGLTTDDVAVYDYDKMVEHLVKVDGMSVEDAEDFISHNTIRSLPHYQGCPSS